MVLLGLPLDEQIPERALQPGTSDGFGAICFTFMGANVRSPTAKRLPSVTNLL